MSTQLRIQVFWDVMLLLGQQHLAFQSKVLPSSSRAEGSKKIPNMGDRRRWRGNVTSKCEKLTQQQSTNPRQTESTTAVWKPKTLESIGRTTMTTFPTVLHRKKSETFLHLYLSPSKTPEHCSKLLQEALGIIISMTVFLPAILYFNTVLVKLTY
jgi:hypothetical protein